MPSKHMSHEDKVERFLELILRVLCLQVGSDKSVTERVRLLKMAGLDNRTIASVLNTTDATVRALASNLREPHGSRRR